MKTEQVFAKKQGFYPSAVVCLGLLLVLLTMRCVPARNSPAATGWAWQKADFEKGRLVQVGNHRLPMPLTFPQGLTPLEGKAMVDVSHTQNHEWECFLFFPADKEADLRRWTGGFPKDFPLPAGTYRIVKGPTTINSGRNWDNLINVDTSTIRMRLVAQTWFSKPGPENWMDETTSALSEGMADVQSPIRNSVHFESLAIVYYNLETLHKLKAMHQNDLQKR